MVRIKQFIRPAEVSHILTTTLYNEALVIGTLTYTLHWKGRDTCVVVYCLGDLTAVSLRTKTAYIRDT